MLLMTFNVDMPEKKKILLGSKIAFQAHGFCFWIQLLIIVFIPTSNA